MVTGVHGLQGNLTLCTGGKTTFAVNERICFIEWIKNTTGSPISYGLIGVGAANQGGGANQFQTSWDGALAEGQLLWIDPGCIGPTDRCKGEWEDGIRIKAPGTYRLTLQLCYSSFSECLNGGTWETLSGGIIVTVQ